MATLNRPPRHVSIIMDGNGRWAEAQGFSRAYGHRQGVLATHLAIEVALEHRVEILSLFAFGQENWGRAPHEIKHLFQLLGDTLMRELPRLIKHKIQVRFVGDRTRLSNPLQKQMARVEAMTRSYHGLKLVIAVNYSGRWDIVQAMHRLVALVQGGHLEQASMDEACFAGQLSLADLPDPDLLIRTSGEKRMSNFMLWQLAYTEFYFTDVHWPAFSKQDFVEALQDFRKRRRRFGLEKDYAKSTQ